MSANGWVETILFMTVGVTFNNSSHIGTAEDFHYVLDILTILTILNWICTFVSISTAQFIVSNALIVVATTS